MPFQETGWKRSELINEIVQGFENTINMYAVLIGGINLLPNLGDGCITCTRNLKSKSSHYLSKCIFPFIGSIREKEENY